mgnify:FL=1
MKVIFVKYFEEDGAKLDFNPKGNWVDLYTACDVYMNQGNFCLIPLGVAMQLPPHHEAIIAPRSSTFKRWGIIQTNSIGIIDETYCGENDEWKFPALATKQVYIPKGTRIAQFRVFASQDAFEEIRLVEVQELKNKDRGGFGSTGA